VSASSCVFCRIIGGAEPANVVLDDAHVVAFLDHRPLFVGHCLVVPRAHLLTLTDLPAAELQPFFERVQRVAKAVERGLGAQGSFVAMNNRVSQSVPHLHAHVVPRTKGDGLKGFFWPRQKPTGPELVDAARRIVAAL
jgi:histidine triad (HIT) family protein